MPKISEIITTIALVAFVFILVATTVLGVFFILVFPSEYEEESLLLYALMGFLLAYVVFRWRGIIEAWKSSKQDYYNREVTDEDKAKK